jgi:hypothetical protein
MPKSTAGRSTPHDRYWNARVRSREFKRALTDLITRELKSLARERAGDVIDAQLVRTMLRELDTRVINRAIVADLIIEGSRRGRRRLDGREESLLDVLDHRLVADIEAALEKSIALSPRAEEFVTILMRKEFVRSLFTDVTYTAISSFNQRVNPLFGALATHALEDQIKGSIRLFMPMLQTQAIAFVIDRGNQRLVLDFARAVLRLLLEVPAGRYAAIAASTDGKAMQTLIRKVVKNAKLGVLMRQLALAFWDDLYDTIRHRRIGELVRLDEHAEWLAQRAVAVALPALSRPHVRRFIAAEIALAAARRT